ncbi:Uncharacterised protein [Mycobacteroides abscessus subsp. abscessus]|nr:Uncharacterised protein [Mycobacteroides abscessus subsp. abscessus]
MDLLLLRLCAHPPGHARQVLIVELDRHLQVDHRGLELERDLLAEDLLHCGAHVHVHLLKAVAGGGLPPASRLS